jgi:hypothetical protein
VTVAIDKAALTRAMAACRAQGAASARQLDAKLAAEPWETVARFASYSAQIASLGLQPWQDPPAVINLDAALRQPFGDARGAREAGEILRRLLDAGLSRYEPDPMRALAEVEAKPWRRSPGGS